MQQAHNRDGLPEIAAGLFFLLASGLTYAQAVLPPGSIGFRAAVVVPAFLIPPLCLGLPWALRWVRRRYLIARVGYVQYKPIGRKQIAPGIIMAVLMAVALLGVVPRLPEPDRWVLAGTGLFGGALAAFCGQQARFVIGGIVTAGIGLFVAFSGVTLLVGFTIIFGLAGLLSLISGTAVFLRFIRQPIEAGE